MALANGTLIGGRYRVTATLGAGGMGTVYLTHDQNLDRDVAVKVLAEHLATNAEYQARFAREAELAAKMRHPSVVRIYDRGEDDNHPFIVMEWVDGPDLDAVLATAGPLPASRVATVISQLAAGIDAAHRNQLVHRDIKPANVLIESTGHGDQARLTDFGIARSLDAVDVTREPATIAYTAPEEFQPGAAGPSADIYSLGCMAFKILTGVLPFRGDSPSEVMMAHIVADRPTVTSHRPELSPAVDDVIRRVLAVKPLERYSTATAFASALTRALDEPDATTIDTTHTPTTPAAPVRPQRWWLRSRRARLVAAALSLVAVIMVAGVVSGRVLDSGSNGTTQGLPATPWAPVSIPQQWGTLSLTDRPVRVAALGTSDAEIVSSLGVNPVIVSNGDDRLPPEWAGVSTTASAGVAGSLDYAALQRAKPDLIVTTSTITKLVYDKLSNIAPTLNLPADNVLARLSDRVTWIAHAIGADNAAKTVLDELPAHIAKARGSADFNGKRVSIIVYRGPDSIDSVLAKSWPTDFLTSLGFTYAPELQATSTASFLERQTDDNAYRARVDMDLIVILRTDANRGGGGFGGLSDLLSYMHTPMAVVDDQRVVAAMLHGGPRSVEPLAKVMVPLLADALRP